MMKKKRRVVGLTRRTFLKASAVTAAAVSCTSVIQFGCAKDTLDVVPSTRHLHFDLSHSHPGETYTLQMGGTSYPMAAHTDESRQLHRTANPDLHAIADENLTHYIEDVVMPETVMLSWITHANEIQGRRGTHSLVLAAIHIPGASKAKAAAKAQAMRANRAVARAAATETPDVEGHISPYDCAKSLVFHHPEIMSLDPDIAAQVHVHIENQPNFLNDLALSLSRQGAAYEYDPDYQDGWAVLDPILDEDGNRHKDEDGNDIYNYRLSDETLLNLGPAVQAVLKTIKNDTDLEGISWVAADGVSAIRQSDPVVTASLVRAAGEAANYQFGFEKVQTLYGVDIEIDPATTTETVIGINIYNYWLRNLGFYVQYLDAEGMPVPLATLGLAGWMGGIFDTTDDALLVGLVNPRLSVFGVPVWEKDLIRESFTIELPAGVGSIRILYGGLGSTGWESDNNWKLATIGSGMTLIMGYVVPIFMLAITTPPDPIKFKALVKWLLEPRQLAVLGGIVVFADTIYSLTQKTVINSGNEAAVKAALKIAANKGAAFLFTSLVELFVKIKEYQLEGAVEKLIPFAGWGLYAAESVATLASLAETTVECLMSPLVVENRLSFTHDIKVSIFPDLNHPGQFPASASRYIITAVFGQGNYRVIEKAIATTTLSAISETFTDIPAGGEVEINVGFYSATGLLAGHGVSNRVANVTGGGALEVPAFHIEEKMVPLTSATLYAHKQKLTFNGVKHTWLETTAPTTTKAELVCGSTGFNLCQLLGITMSQRANMLAYGWRAAGQGVLDCDSGASGGQLHTFQNISAGADPDSALMFSNCGFSMKPLVAYDLLGAPNGDHYFIDPRGGEYHLRKVDLANTASGFDLSKDKSYGRFATFLDAAVIHQGVIIGINTLYSKIEVLTLPAAPSLDISAPCAVLMSGEGTREGLLHRPVALSVGSDGTIYILEEQNNRVQALDISGNPIRKFSTGIDPYFFSLKTEGETVKYLDMGVEYSGYVYVLSHINSGFIAQDYRIDIYTPDGAWLARTEGVAAAKMVVDHWRNMYTLNYEMFNGPGGRTEPSVSQWTPSSPSSVAGLMRSVLKSFVALKTSLT